ncbi:type VI secretion system-associated FHA domain protein TagH [Rhodovulum sp. DZ06]|uniref:type VI secretion system-associated FHA domain protein TagH n=1 Tax=Rhodovulum sp. DZ06 TaxID=3425126 RepID=UPI003D3549FF
MQVTITVSGAASCAGGNIRTVEIGAAPFVIGRRDGCHLVMQNDPTISGAHCELREEGGTLVLTDRSTNGTYIGAKTNKLVPGQPTSLPDSVRILVGDAVVELSAARDGAGDAFSGAGFDEELFKSGPSGGGDADDPFGLGGGLAGGPGGGGGNDPFGGGGDAPLFPDAPKPAEHAWDRHAPATPDMHFKPGAAAPGPGPADPFGGAPSGGAGGGDDFFGKPAAPAPDPFGAAKPADPFGGAPGKRPATGGLPDDWMSGMGGDGGGGAGKDADDPFAGLDDAFAGFGGGAPAQEPPAKAETPPATDPFGGAPFGGAEAPKPAADPAPAAPPPAADPFGGTDPFAAAPQADPAPAPGATPAPAPPPPAEAAAPGAPAPAAPAPAPAPAADDGSAAALAALFDAVGMTPPSDDPEAALAFAAEIGRQHRAMADALRRLLLMRRDAKLAFGVRQTQVEMGMNPLKWAPDAGAAVEALLGKDTGSFKRGQNAIDDAVESLEAHQMAMIGAVRAGLKVSVAAFDPAALEGKLASKGLSAVVPQFRRAELWEKFCENYARFAEDVDEDIRSVLGRELDRLYDGSGRS